MCAASVRGWPLVSIQILSLRPFVSTTKSSPSQRPIEYPCQVGFGSLGSGRPSVKISRKIGRDSYKITVSPGNCMILNGDVTASFSGTPEGRHVLLGSSRPRFARRSLYRAAAQGWKGTSSGFRSAAMLIRYFKPLGIQIPVMSGLPSLVRGKGADMSGFASLVRGAFLVG